MRSFLCNWDEWRVSHDSEHPRLQGLIVSRGLVEKGVRHTFGRWSNCSKSGITLYSEQICKLSDLRPVDFDEGYLVISIPLSHVCNNLIEVIEHIVTPSALFHEEVNEDNFVFKLSFDQGLVLIERANLSCLALRPPLARH